MKITMKIVFFICIANTVYCCDEKNITDICEQFVPLQSIASDVIVVLGTTGSGKSTFCNYLTGVRLKGEEQDWSLTLVIADNIIPNTFAIGHEGACTLIPQSRVAFHNQKEYCVWDVPGFMDTRSITKSVQSNCLIHKLFSTLSNPIILFTLEWITYFGGDRPKEEFLKLEANLNRLFPCESFVDGLHFGFVVTKVDATLSRNEVMAKFKDKTLYTNLPQNSYVALTFKAGRIMPFFALEDGNVAVGDPSEIFTMFSEVQRCACDTMGFILPDDHLERLQKLFSTSIAAISLEYSNKFLTKLKESQTIAELKILNENINKELSPGYCLSEYSYPVVVAPFETVYLNLARKHLSSSYLRLETAVGERYYNILGALSYIELTKLKEQLQVSSDPNLSNSLEAIINEQKRLVMLNEGIVERFKDSFALLLTKQFLLEGFKSYYDRAIESLTGKRNGLLEDIKTSYTNEIARLKLCAQAITLEENKKADERVQKAAEIHKVFKQIKASIDQCIQDNNDKSSDSIGNTVKTLENTSTDEINPLWHDCFKQEHLTVLLPEINKQEIYLQEEIKQQIKRLQDVLKQLVEQEKEAKKQKDRENEQQINSYFDELRKSLAAGLFNTASLPSALADLQRMKTAAAQKDTGCRFQSSPYLTQAKEKYQTWFEQKKKNFLLIIDSRLVQAQMRNHTQQAKYCFNSQDFPSAYVHAKQADQKDSIIEFILGKLYHMGTGVRQNYSEAVRLYLLAAKQNNASAQYNLGMMYSHGTGVRQNYSEAVELYRLAAQQGLDVAQCSLGVMYSNGTGVEQDNTKAVLFFAFAAAQGLDVAQCNLGVMYYNGIGVKRNYTEAVRWFQLAVDQNARAQCKYRGIYWISKGINYAMAVISSGASKVIGMMCSHGTGVQQNDSTVISSADEQSLDLMSNGTEVEQDNTKAVLFKLATDQNARAQCKYCGTYWISKGINYAMAVISSSFSKIIGWRYENGTEAVRLSRLLKLYRLAANQGLANAQCNLGVMYEKGHGVEQNYTEAVRLYSLAADQKNARAQFSLGCMLSKGTGVKRNYKKAVKLYRLAANQGLANAQCNLGVMYEKGHGVEQNYTEAVRLYSLAADQKNARAQCNLGVMYSNGTGVKRNYT